MGELPGGDASPRTFQPPGLPSHPDPHPPHPHRCRCCVRGRRGHTDVLEVGVRVSEDGQPFSRLCSMPIPPRQDPTHPRMPGVRVRVPPPGSWGPTLRTSVSSPQPHACCCHLLGGHRPQTWRTEGVRLGAGKHLQVESSFQEAFDLSPPSLWVIFSPEIPPRKPHGAFFPPPPAVINPVLTQPTSSS